MENENRGGVFECVRRNLRRVWRFLCCGGTDDTEIPLSVEETMPVLDNQSSVRPY